jgi:hypothetical protein
MASQKAYWYNLIAPYDSDLSRKKSLEYYFAVILVINVKTAIMHKVLEVCGLGQKRRHFLANITCLHTINCLVQD